MKENKLSIIIHSHVDDVFNFTLNTDNNSKWISDIETEETNEWQAKVGTIHRNKSRTSVWNQ